MAIANETILTPLQAALKGGLEDISQYVSISFQQYTKVTQPIDGSVFWVLNPLQAPLVLNGSLHYSSKTNQDQDQTIAINNVVLTTAEEVSDLNEAQPETLWITDVITDSRSILKVAFSSRVSFYRQAGVWHYHGEALYPALATQVVASIEEIPTSPIVSNSLPVFLGFKWPNVEAPIPHYASYLVPDNIKPPYVSVHIDPGATEVLAVSPMLDDITTIIDPLTHIYSTTQLCKDSVELILYGFNNQQAIQYKNALEKYSILPGDFGFMTSPVIRDEKRKQSEMNILAMKKKIIMDVSYVQSTADAVTYKLIKEAHLSSITILRST